MGRTVKEARITTPTARSKLAVSKMPHWRAIDRGAHLGYRKGTNGGTWIARYRRSNRKYVTGAIGKSDDALVADGASVLSYSQALARARDWCHSEAGRERGGGPSGPYTVADAMADYLDWFAVHRKSLDDVRQRIKTYIIPPLGEMEVNQLTSRRIRKWHEDLATVPPRVRTGVGRPQNYRATSDDPDYTRRRRHTANKVLTILKAACNHAYHNDEDERVPSDEAWRRVKPFRHVDEPRVRYLDTDESVRLLNACEPDFRALATGALMTGCRYGELITMICKDFKRDTGSVHVRFTKSGKSRNVPLTDEGRAFFDQLSAGRPKSRLMFVRRDGAPWGRSQQQRPIITACKAAKIEPPISFHILRHTYGSALAMQGVSLQVIAEALGHADTRITHRHYAALAPSYVSQAIREGLPELGIAGTGEVVPLSGKRAPRPR